VIHFSPPPSVEAYLQESGRGGRDGGPCEAILLFDLCGNRRRGSAKAESAQDEGREKRRRAFLAYASSAGCRRKTLHALMGAELESPCSGCDICDGSDRKEPEGLAELKDFLAANPGRFDLESALRLIGTGGCGSRASSGRKEPPSCPGEGLLGNWDGKDLRVLFSAAIAEGHAAKIESGSRAGRLRPARTGPAEIFSHGNALEV
jgi:hypothetical protein